MRRGRRAYPLLEEKGTAILKAEGFRQEQHHRTFALMYLLSNDLPTRFRGYSPVSTRCGPEHGRGRLLVRVGQLFRSRELSVVDHFYRIIPPHLTNTVDVDMVDSFFVLVTL